MAAVSPAAVNYRHCFAADLVTSESKRSAELRDDERAEMHLLPTWWNRQERVRNIQAEFQLFSSLIKIRPPKSVGLNYRVRETRQESHFVDVEMTLSFLPTAMTQSC